MRSTTLSPDSVGMVETRRSISRPRTVALMRPSCGRRRSAMFRLAMILMREVTAARSDNGSVSTVCSMPSMRKRTRSVILARLDMDVGGLCLSGARDEIVHEPDDRRLARHVLKAANVILAGPLGGGRSRFAADLGATSVQPLERSLDLAGRHHTLLDRASEQVADGVDRLPVERIGRRNHQGVALLGNRNDAVAHQEIELQVIGEKRYVRQVLGIGEGNAQELGQQPCHMCFRHQA